MFFRHPKNTNNQNTERSFVEISNAQWEQAIAKYQLDAGCNSPRLTNNEILFQLLYHEFASVKLAEANHTSPNSQYCKYARASERDSDEYRVVAEFSLSQERLTQLFNTTIVVSGLAVKDSDNIRKQFNHHLIRLMSDTKNHQHPIWEKYRDLYVPEKRCAIL